MTFQTEQEAFWAGEFGNAYIERNQSAEQLASNLDFFSRSLSGTRNLDSCIEFGANVGMNLRALKLLYPQQQQHAVEINPKAAQILSEFLPTGHVVNQSILTYRPNRMYDLVLIRGVLIHINPDMLHKAYEALHEATGRYLLVSEYYNPTPVSLPYRGHTERLYKRDFAGEIMDQYPDLRLINYGCCYRRDPRFVQDDENWFLMEKVG